MASIVEWQSLKMQEYRYSLRNRLLIGISSFYELFGVHRPLKLDLKPAEAGDYNHALHVDHPGAPSLLEQYLSNSPKKEPKLGGSPKVTESSSENDQS